MSLFDGAHSQVLDWPLPSPRLARQFPKNSRAAHSGFRGSPVVASAGSTWRFALQEAGAEESPVAHVKLEAIPRARMTGIFVAPWSIGYQAIPKVACTSIKDALFTLVTAEQPVRTNLAGSQNVHTYFGARASDMGGAKFKFVVLRDPIKRFLSGFNNRVVQYRELSEAYLRSQNLQAVLDLDGFVPDPTLAQFVDRIELYMRVPTIHHHFRPVSEIISPLAAFDKVYPFEELPQMCRDIARLAQRPFSLPHAQRTAAKHTTKNLSSTLRDRLLSLCASDYELMRDYYAPAGPT